MLPGVQCAVLSAQASQQDIFCVVRGGNQPLSVVPVYV